MEDPASNRNTTAGVAGNEQNPHAENTRAQEGLPGDNPVPPADEREPVATQLPAEPPTNSRSGSSETTLVSTGKDLGIELCDSDEHGLRWVVRNFTPA
jgi:hypothetical protein